MPDQWRLKSLMGGVQVLLHFEKKIALVAVCDGMPVTQVIRQCF